MYLPKPKFDIGIACEAFESFLIWSGNICWHPHESRLQVSIVLELWSSQSSLLSHSAPHCPFMHWKVKGSGTQSQNESQSPKPSLVPCFVPRHVVSDWLQNGLLKVEGNSHCSKVGNTKPSPQILFVQSFLQASLLLLFPSSHCSLPSFKSPPVPCPFGVCLNPSPQKVNVQSSVHWSKLLPFFPS